MSKSIVTNRRLSAQLHSNSSGVKYYSPLSIMRLVAFLIMPFLFFSLSCTQEKERLLFSSSRNGNSDIFLMDADGNTKTALTHSEFEEWGPTWINENEISLLRQIEDSILRVKLNLKTKKETSLKHPKNCLLDDKNVLYANHLAVYPCKKDIFIVNSVTNQMTNITSNLEGMANYPSWSHDGKSVLFTSNHLGRNQLFQYQIDSKEIKQLTYSDSNNERGELSPNGRFLVYSSDYFEKGNQDIVLQELESGAIKNLSKSPGMELIARFSNDGKKIFFGTNKDENWEIYAIDLETENQVRLTSNTEFDGDPRVFKFR